MKKTFLAIIPARGGSKGIPGKNLINLKGKPLIDYSIQAAQNSKYISEIVVSSDDAMILNHVKGKMGVLALDRPSYLATDDSPTEPVISHVLETLNEKVYDAIVLLQPTSPLRSTESIEKAIELYLANQVNSVISVVKPDFHPLKSFKLNEEGFLIGLINNEFPFMPRQSLPEIYQPNGAIYIVSTSYFEQTNKLLSDKTIPFIMNRVESMDVDDETDLNRIEFYLKERNS